MKLSDDWTDPEANDEFSRRMAGWEWDESSEEWVYE